MNSTVYSEKPTDIGDLMAKTAETFYRIAPETLTFLP
jgi:hypothetical protein